MNATNLAFHDAKIQSSFIKYHTIIFASSDEKYNVQAGSYVYHPLRASKYKKHNSTVSISKGLSRPFLIRHSPNIPDISARLFSLHYHKINGIPEISCPPKLAAFKATTPILHTRCVRKRTIQPQSPCQCKPILHLSLQITPTRCPETQILVVIMQTFSLHTFSTKFANSDKKKQNLPRSQDLRYISPTPMG